MITVQVDTMMDGPRRYVPVHVVQTDADAIECQRWCMARIGQRLGLDAETNAEVPQDPAFQLRTVQISDGIECWYLTDTVPLLSMMAVVNCGVQWVAHFAGLAEIPFLHNGLPGVTDRWGPNPVILDNIVLMAHYDPRILPPRAKVAPGIVHEKGLKPTVERELSPCLRIAEESLHRVWHEWAPKGERTPKKMKRWGFAHTPVLFPQFVIYACLDAIMLKRLWDKAYVEITRRGLAEIVESDLLVQWDIQCADGIRGLPVDEPYARWLDAELLRVVEQEAAWLAPYGIPPSALGNSIDVAFRTAGVAMPSYDKHHLKAFLDDEASAAYPVARELAEHITTVRRAGKFRSTYTAPMLDSCTRDHRLHSQVLACGTVTHRMSSSQPNIQNLPKKDTRIRAAFGSVPGWTFVSCDFAQGEPRTLAAASGDPNLIADVNSGDVNSAIATAAFGSAYDRALGRTAGTPHYLMRQGGKAGLLAVWYGCGDDTLARTLGVPLEQAKGVRSAWRARYRVVFDRAEQQGRQGSVRLRNGRVIPLWDRFFVYQDQLCMRDKPSRKPLNYETQGQQRDYLVHAWQRLRALPGREYWRYLALFLHDEIVLLVPDALAEQAAIDLKWAMTFELGNGITMTCEATIDGPTMVAQPAELDLSELSSVDAVEEVPA